MRVPGFVSIAVVAVAVALAAIGTVYFLVQCQHIPAPLPGREAGSTEHRPAYAAVSFALATFVLGAGAFGNRLRARSA